MIKSKLPKEQYEMIPASFVEKAIKGYNSMALREKDNDVKKIMLLRSEALSDLLKSWFIYTVSQEPDVIESAQKAFNDAVDSVRYDGKSICKVFDEEQEKDGLF